MFPFSLARNNVWGWYKTETFPAADAHCWERDGSVFSPYVHLVKSVCFPFILRSRLVKMFMSCIDVIGMSRFLFHSPLSFLKVDHLQSELRKCDTYTNKCDAMVDSPLCSLNCTSRRVKRPGWRSVETKTTSNLTHFWSFPRGRRMNIKNTENSIWASGLSPAG